MIVLARLKKDELVWMATHRCPHHHYYIEHPKCYEQAGFNQERVGFIDIESSNLDADFGVILSYCIKVKGKDKIYKGLITKEDLNDGLDKRIVTQLIKDMGNFDRLVGYYSTKFDIPYIRTRALANGVVFPYFKAIKHTDVYPMAKYKLKVHSNRLENVCRIVIGKTEKTHIEAKYWIGALRGDKNSLSYILDHNIKDVKDLEKVFNALSPFVNITNTSI